MKFNKKKAGYTFVQMLAGGCAGLLVGFVLLKIVNFAWSGLEQLYLHGFIKGLLLLISFLIILGGTIAVTSELVLLLGRFIPRETTRRRVYEGCFLGICTAVAILTMTRGDWMGALEEWGGPIRLIATILYFVVVLPVKLFTFWIPALLMLLVAAPIGAAIGYNLPPHIKPPQKANEPDVKSRKS